MSAACAEDDPTAVEHTPSPSAHVRFANVGGYSIPVDFELRPVSRDGVIARHGLSDGEFTRYVEVNAGNYEIRDRAPDDGWSAWREIFIGRETLRTVLAGYLPAVDHPVRYISGNVLDPRPTGDDRALVRIHYFYPDGPVTDVVRHYTGEVLYASLRYPISVSVDHFPHQAGPPRGPFRIMAGDSELFTSAGKGLRTGLAYTMLIWGWDAREGLRYTIAVNDPDSTYSPPPPRDPS